MAYQHSKSGSFRIRNSFRTVGTTTGRWSTPIRNKVNSGKKKEDETRGSTE